MRSSLLALVLLSACSGPGLEPNRHGEYDLGDGHTLVIWAAGADLGKCDWWSVNDYPEMREDDQPGFCVAEGWVEGSPQNWILWWGANGGVHQAYAGTNVSLVYGGSEAGERTNIKLSDVDRSGWNTFELVIGDENAPEDASVHMLDLKGKRFKPL